MKDLFKEIWSVLSHNKLRTILTGVSVAWGIFMLICLLGTGNGLTNAIGRNMDEMVPTMIQIFSGSTKLPYAGFEPGRWVSTEEKDLAILESPDIAPYIDQVVLDTEWQGVTAVNGVHALADVYMQGVSANYFDVFKLKLAAGRHINEKDRMGVRKVAVIAERMAKSLYPGTGLESVIGKTVNLGSSVFIVVGILHAEEGSSNTNCYIPYETMRTLYSSRILNPMVFTFKGLHTKAQNAEFEKRITARLNAMHNIHPDDDVFYIWNRYTGNMEMHTVFNVINIALWIIGLLTLLGGIVSVANIMLISVRERTKEFGIRKALGARPASVLGLVIAESITITSIAGFIGMFLGFAGCRFIDSRMGQPIKVTWGEMNMLKDVSVGWDVALEVTVVMIVAGTIAGLIPAYKASHIKPVEAISAN